MRFYIYSDNNCWIDTIEANDARAALLDEAGENPGSYCPEDGRFDFNQEDGGSIWAVPAPPSTAIQSTELYLAANGLHLANHPGADYVYTNPNGFDYADHASAPVDIEDAFRHGWLYVTERGIEGLVETIPMPFDFQKIRRRVEDALRKTADNRILIEVATRLGCRLD